MSRAALYCCLKLMNCSVTGCPGVKIPSQPSSSRRWLRHVRLRSWWGNDPGGKQTSRNYRVSKVLVPLTNIKSAINDTFFLLLATYLCYILFLELLLSLLPIKGIQTPDQYTIDLGSVFLTKEECTRFPLIWLSLF